LPRWCNKYAEKSPSWEANNISAYQEISPMLWNLKVHYRIRKCPPMVSLLIHMHSVHSFQLYLHNIQFHINFPNTPRFFEWSLPFRFSDQIFNYFSSFLYALDVPVIVSTLVCPKSIWWSSSIWSLLQSPTLPPSQVHITSWVPCSQMPWIYLHSFT